MQLFPKICNFEKKYEKPMENLFFFRPEEQTHLKDLYRSLLRLSGKVLKPDDCANLKNYLVQAGLNNFLKRDVFDLNPIITDME